MFHLFLESLQFFKKMHIMSTYLQKKEHFKLSLCTKINIKTEIEMYIGIDYYFTANEFD